MLPNKPTLKCNENCENSFSVYKKGGTKLKRMSNY